MSRAELYNSYQQFVNATCNPDLDLKGRYGNVALGVAGEAAEVLELTILADPTRMADVAELSKELGDIMWYVALGFVTLEESMWHWVCESENTNHYPDPGRLCLHAGRLADVVKKHLHQGHVLNFLGYRQNLIEVMLHVKALAYKYGYSLDGIVQMNMEKLKARYPEGHFSVERSVNRTAE